MAKLTPTIVEKYLNDHYPDHFIYRSSSRFDNFWEQKAKLLGQDFEFRTYSPSHKGDKCCVAYYLPIEVDVLDINNEPVKVTDLDAALTQAKDGVYFHEQKEKNGDELQFLDAAKWWKDMHYKLQKISREYGRTWFVYIGKALHYKEAIETTELKLTKREVFEYRCKLDGFVPKAMKQKDFLDNIDKSDAKYYFINLNGKGGKGMAIEINDELHLFQ